MSNRKSRRRASGTFGTAFLGLLCLVSAIAYTVTVASSLISFPEPSSMHSMDAVGAVQGLSSAPTANLRVVVDDGVRAREHTLVCSGDPAADPAACGRLAEKQDPFEEVAPQAVCTEITYGPQSATITGHWNGTEIETEVSRVNSCEEARWQRLHPLVEVHG